MAFASSITNRTVFGNMRVHIGTFTQASGDTGGSITTGLRDVLFFNCMAATNLSESSGVVTVTTANPGTDQAGYWAAIGY